MYNYCSAKIGLGRIAFELAFDAATREADKIAFNIGTVTPISHENMLIGINPA